MQHNDRYMVSAQNTKNPMVDSSRLLEIYDHKIKVCKELYKVGYDTTFLMDKRTISLTKNERLIMGLAARRLKIKGLSDKEINEVFGFKTYLKKRIPRLLKKAMPERSFD